MNTRSIRFRLTVWYAGLLAGSLALLGASVYVGLAHYLNRTLRESLLLQALQIGDTLVANINQSGEAYVIDEIKEHFAPEINGRFIRITREGGEVIYVSGLPRDRSFDPSGLGPVAWPIDRDFAREQKMSGDGELLIQTITYTARDGSRFSIEAGAPDTQIDSVLHGLLLTLALGLPVVVGLAIGGGYLLTRRALAPVGEITRSAELITSRNLGERLPEAKTGDEIEAL